MILGMPDSTFTLVHVVLSLIGIVCGIVVVVGMLSAKRLAGLTAVFLATTVLTSATGFLFPFTSFGPPQIIGALSLAVLAVAILALYVRRLAGFWRWVYVIGAMLALYLNCFVGVVQAFQKLPFLQSLAPTQSEPPFAIAQVAVMAIFIVLGIGAVRKFHPVRGLRHRRASLHPQFVLPVPIFDRKLGVLLERLVAPPDCGNDPARLVFEHEVDQRGRHRQRRIDRGRERMHEVRPMRIEQPQRARAFAAEIPLPAADLAIIPVIVADHGAVDAQRPAAGNGQGLRHAHDVDGKAAAARGLTADRAIAELVGMRRMRGEPEPHRAAAARTFKCDRHGRLRLGRSSPESFASAAATRHRFDSEMTRPPRSLSRPPIGALTTRRRS